MVVLADALVLLSAGANGAGTNGFEREMITLSANGGASRFADVDGDGRLDLLAVDPVRKKLLIYRQRASGFKDAAEQIVGLPPQTGWIGLCDVDAHPGLELVMSTVAGLVFCRQNGGVFEEEPQTLIKAGQVFTNDDAPRLIWVATNAALPVISATQAVVYQRNAAFGWRPEPPIALKKTGNSWAGERNQWLMGSISSRGMQVYESMGAKPDAHEEKPENDTIKKLVEAMKKDAEYPWFGEDRADLNGDGRKDYVLWHVMGDRLYPRTDVYVFLRGGDGRLPERPTQVLHGRGFPVPIGSTENASAVGDLKGGGTRELVLLELKTLFTSANSLVEAVVSRGLDWALTIRSVHENGFSPSPDAVIPLTGILLSDEAKQWPLFICGDFNGDGRPDFVIQRTSTQWKILFSTSDGRWFAPQPAMTFEAPALGMFEIKDLNGDGRSDIVLRAMDEPRMYVFLSTSGARTRTMKQRESRAPRGRVPRRNRRGRVAAHGNCAQTKGKGS